MSLKELGIRRDFPDTILEKENVYSLTVATDYNVQEMRVLLVRTAQVVEERLHRPLLNTMATLTKDDANKPFYIVHF